MGKLDWEKTNKNRTGEQRFARKKLKQHPKEKKKSFWVSCRKKNSELLAEYEAARQAFEIKLKERIREKILNSPLRYRSPKAK